MRDVGLVKVGGFANKAGHDAFCPKLDCVISKVYDQSPMGNHLGQRHKLVNASQHKIAVGTSNKVEVYGMYFDPGYGYHVDYTKGIATGNEPESIYAVMSGTHTNGRCCFDVRAIKKTRCPILLGRRRRRTWRRRRRRRLWCGVVVS